MKRTSMDKGWKLTVGAGNFDFSTQDIPGTVDLPHDYSVSTETRADAPTGKANAFYDGAYLSYTKMFTVPEEMKDKRLLLEIDGAYMNSQVWVNGNVCAARPYGYAPYHADMTEYINCGENNEIKITVNNSSVPNTRWYSGSGLYRHVDMLEAGDIHIAPWGIYAFTRSLQKGCATVNTEITAENHSGRKTAAKIKVTILDREGEVAACGYGKAVIMPASSAKCRVRLSVENPRLWDIADPYLYSIKAEIVSDDGILLDSEEINFGIRTISVDPKNGFMLNGRSLKLYGGCIHHDNGLLGAAAFDDADYRRVKIHKENGYNALRSTHNPPSRSLLDACDKLGMLVIDEAFDMWNEGKNIGDYHNFFADWWKRDIDAMVLRDRNHPSVIMWSIGNEIPEHGGSSDGWQWAAKLSEEIRSLDDTRFVSSALNNIQPYGKELSELIEAEGEFDFTGPKFREYNKKYFMDATEGFAAPLDVVGFNYMDYIYDDYTAEHPERILCGFESFPVESDLIWDQVERMPNLIGDFIWTSWDYLGEAGIGKVEYKDGKGRIDPVSAFSSEFPWRLGNDADFDICGNDRPQLHYRQIVWGSGETYICARTPESFGKGEFISKWGWPGVYRNWNYQGSEGENTSVDVYSAAEETELFINGRSLGRKPCGKKQRYTANFTVPYEAGELKALSYSGGKTVSEDVLVSTGRAESIILKPESMEIKADGQSLCYVNVEIADKDGNTVTGAKLKLKAAVKGAGSLIAFGSADPVTTDNYSSGKCFSFNGRAQAIIRAGEQTDSIVLTVEGEGLPASEIEISAI